MCVYIYNSHDKSRALIGRKRGLSEYKPQSWFITFNHAMSRMESPLLHFDRFDTLDDELLQSVSEMEKLGGHRQIHTNKPLERAESH